MGRHVALGPGGPAPTPPPTLQKGRCDREKGGPAVRADGISTETVTIKCCSLDSVTRPPCQVSNRLQRDMYPWHISHTRLWAAVGGAAEKPLV